MGRVMVPVLLSMLVFSILHSLLAGQRLKQFFRSWLGERAYYGVYRVSYNLFAAVSLLPVIWASYFLPANVIWATEGVIRPVLLCIQGVGLAGLLVSLLQIDLGRFLGWSQLCAYVSRQPLPLPPEALQQGGVYALVRHPLYLFSLMVIWPMPVMTDTILMFNLGATLYFVLGSLLEEKRLIAVFGPVYADYQRRVPWLIPGWRRG